LKLSVIIPVYNEVRTIAKTIERVRRVDIEKEIVVVDDFSTDGTRELLSQIPDITLVLHKQNMGKGFAIRTALEHVTGDVVVIQDADLEYIPEDFPFLIAPILDGEAEVVYGSRFMKARPIMRRANYIANRMLAAAANILYGAHITDEATCYKAFKASLIKSIPLTCKRFEFCPEVTAKVLRRGRRIIEVPVRYEARTCEQGKKIGWWDGVVALWTLIKFRIVM
jgi:glycosyltransferase involved in cell wall biosynthesis